MMKHFESRPSGVALISALLLLSLASLLTMTAVLISGVSAAETRAAADSAAAVYRLESAMNTLIFLLRSDRREHPVREIDSEAYASRFSRERWQADGVEHELTLDGEIFRCRIWDAAGLYSIDGDPEFAGFEERWTEWMKRGEAWDFDEKLEFTRMAGRLRDYADGDDMETAAGGEADFYTGLKMYRLPRNAPPQFTGELHWIPDSEKFLDPGGEGRFAMLQPAAPAGLPGMPFQADLYSTPVRRLAALADLSEREEEMLAEAREAWLEEQTPLGMTLEPELFQRLLKIAPERESGYYLLEVAGRGGTARAVIAPGDPAGGRFIEYYDLSLR